jgi:hypothetical protein
MERLIDRTLVPYVTQFTYAEGGFHGGCGAGERKDSDHAKAGLIIFRTTKRSLMIVSQLLYQ